MSWLRERAIYVRCESGGGTIYEERVQKFYSGGWFTLATNPASGPIRVHMEMGYWDELQEKMGRGGERVCKDELR